MHEPILKESIKATYGGRERRGALNSRSMMHLESISNGALYGGLPAVETRAISCGAELKRIFRLTNKTGLSPKYCGNHCRLFKSILRYNLCIIKSIIQ